MALSSALRALLSSWGSMPVAALLLAHAHALTTGRNVLEVEPVAIALPGCSYAEEVHTKAMCEEDESMFCVTRTCPADDFLCIVCVVPEDWELNGPEPPNEDCAMVAKIES